MGELIVPKPSPTNGDSASPEDEVRPVSGGMPVDVELRKRQQAAARESNPASASDDDEDDEDDDDDDDEDLIVYTAREAAGALATIYAFIRPLLGNYRKALIAVGIGLLVETLFNVIMPVSYTHLTLPTNREV